MIEIIYENTDWLPFFENALDEMGVDVRLNFIENFQLDVNQPPDNILYLNRISPSADTRSHHQAILRGEQYLEHLAAFNRNVINDLRTYQFEHSKVEQYRLLRRLGLSYPNTIFGSEVDELLNNASALRFPVLTKHNRSGKGLGIRKFDTYRDLETYLKSDEFLPSPDGILLIQEFIKPKNDIIYRLEFIDCQFLYAFTAATTQGFELCPADACAVPEGGKSAAPDQAGSLFTYLPDFEHALIRKYIDLASEAGFDMVGIEFVEAVNGAVYTYDINGTTNYSPDVEEASGHKAKTAFQDMISRRLQ